MKSKRKIINTVIVLIAILLIGFVVMPSPFLKNSTRSDSEGDLNKELVYGSTVENENNQPIETPDGMVWIPGGEFSMGCSVSNESLCGVKGITDDANPIHRVYVDGFWMDNTEVTNKQFAAFVEATG